MSQYGNAALGYICVCIYAEGLSFITMASSGEMPKHCEEKQSQVVQCHQQKATGECHPNKKVWEGKRSMVRTA